MCEKCNIQAREYTGRPDFSLSRLQGLLQDGYETIEWVNTETACDVCQGLHGMVWGLEEFLSETQYDAPIFSHTHPNCLCYLIVRHPNDVEITVDASGSI